MATKCRGLSVYLLTCLRHHIHIGAVHAHDRFTKKRMGIDLHHTEYIRTTDGLQLTVTGHGL